MGSEVGVADKFCRSFLNLVEKFEVALGNTYPTIRTIFQMGPDETLVKRQQLGGREVRQIANKKTGVRDVG